MSQEMHAAACPLSNTDKQTQKTRKSWGFSILPSRFSTPKDVQIYLAEDTPKGVDTALMKMCNDISYKCEISKHIHDLQHDVPLIVVCPVTSGLEHDIDHALNGLDRQSAFIALVLHQVNEHSLPGLPTATRLPEKPKYAEFVDMAYSSEFYACKMNEDAKQTIKERLDDASALPSTNKQAQNTGIFCVSSFLPRLANITSVPRRLVEIIRGKNVQVYLAVNTPEGVGTALMKLCKDMSYNWNISKHIHDRQHDVPLIVVCPVISRLEPDIVHALRGFDRQTAFIVLLLHQGNEDSLPGLPTATRLPEKPKYAKFVDMAYSLEFYACKMNEDAKQEIKAFVDKKISISKI